MVHEPSPLQCTLRLFQTEPISLPYFETNAQHPNKLIFIPGLTDTMGVVPYLPSLASVLNGHHGDDDLFSSYLDSESIVRTLQPALNRAPLLMLFGMNEYVHQTNMAANMHHLM